MKKKKLLIFVAVIILIPILFFCILTTLADKGYGISKGRYLEAKNGQPILILDNSPIQLSDRKNKISFERFDIGDEILVVHDGIEESYPGRTAVYAVLKLSDGTADDIPQTVINSLVELGWLETELRLTDEKIKEPDSSVQTERINCVINKIDGNHFIVEKLDNGKKSGITYQFTYNPAQFSEGDKVTVEFRYPITTSIPYGLRDVKVYESEYMTD